MNSERLRELVDRYHLGIATEDEVAELDAALREDSHARDVFIAAARLETNLYDEAINAIPAGGSDSEPAASKPTASAIASVNSRRAIPMWLGLSVIAATLLIAAFGWFRTPEQAPQGIARVIRIEGQGTTGKDRNVVDGAELFAGEEVAIQQGLIELAFRETGVHVVATAPLSMKLDSDQRVSLREGQVKLVVPPQGVGFVVDTAERKFVDLGTSFVVTASAKGSEVLVLDGQIAVAGKGGDNEHLMVEGDLAKFGRDGEVHLRTEQYPDIAELSLARLTLSPASLPGRILGFEGSPPNPRQRPKQDVIARQILPLVKSGFQEQSCLDVLKQGVPLRFSGIAGSYRTFPARTGLAPYSAEVGWMVWYRGQVMPPKPGRYRFWGYADNHLLVSIDGQPVFEGSRRDSPFKELGIPRSDHPSYPCLNAMAGFACGSWFELGSEGTQLDIVFGEIMNHQTSGLLLVEREGERYEETYWGQPRWPLFLTESPTEGEIAELEHLRKQMEAKLIGSFSITEAAIWKVIDQ